MAPIRGPTRRGSIAPPRKRSRRFLRESLDFELRHPGKRSWKASPRSRTATSLSVHSFTPPPRCSGWAETVPLCRGFGQDQVLRTDRPNPGDASVGPCLQASIEPDGCGIVKRVPTEERKWSEPEGDVMDDSQARVLQHAYYRPGRQKRSGESGRHPDAGANERAF